MIARLSASILLLAAAIQGVQGGWIYLKAELSQVLLERAWRETVAGETGVRPWSWADTWPVGRLIFPAQGEEAVVLEGASGRILAFAPGHLQGTAAPGEDGTCVIAGHRDTHFGVLEALRLADPILLEDATGVTRSYEVRRTMVVEEDDLWALNPGDAETLVLLTCWPFEAIGAHGNQRFVVWARAADQ